jgi:hypothetical protein
MPVQSLNKTIRDDIFRRTKNLILEQSGTLIGNCLEYAWHGYQILKSYPSALRTIIQAGSAEWPRIPKELDDGLCNTHFAYVWNPDDPLTRLWFEGFVRQEKNAISLPEVHIWLACPDTQELIDFTTGTWPEACRKVIGEERLAEQPPEYLWTFGSRLPDGVRYIPDRSAIDLVIQILTLQGREYP